MLTDLPENCYRVSVKAFIQDGEGRILVVKEGDDYWDLPGGGTAHRETFEESLERELREEIGLRVVIGDLREVIKFRALSGIEAMFVIYTCTINPAQQTILGDASELAWKHPAELTGWPFVLMRSLSNT
jgi:8-oxo-dGTP diphosphatase